jgi:hypothetical protein
MWKTAKEMLKSKKFLAAAVSGIVWLVGKVGADLDSEELLGAVTPLWAYIIAQGAADFGKAKATAQTADTETPKA